MRQLFTLSSFILFVIILMGGAVRLINLSQLPAGFHGDEAAYGYNAYSLLKTGTDEYGKPFPLVFKSFEDYKPALYAYIDIPFIATLGLKEGAVRFPSALFGILTIPLLYLVVKELFPKDRWIPLFASGLLAISPWHIMFSRTTSEVIISLFFLLALLYFVLKLRGKFKVYWLLLASLSAFFSLASYTASRITVLILIATMIVMSVRKIKQKWKLPIPLFGLLALVILLEIIFNGFAVNNRFSQVSIFNNPNTQLVLDEQIREDQFVPVLITRLFHNKMINYTRTIIGNVDRYFTLDFLVLNGGLPARQHVPDAGLFYAWEMIFLLVGIYCVFQKDRRNGLLLIVLWITLLIPAAITYDDVPNVQRSITILPVLLILIAIGIRESIFFLRSLHKQYLVGIFIIVLLTVSVYEFSYFLHQYTTHAEKHQPWYRDYAMKGLVAAMNEYGPQFKKIVITKSKTSYIHILFYNKFDPKTYQASGSNMDKDGTGFGVYMFSSRECPLLIDKDRHVTEEEMHTLYVDAGNCKIAPDAEVIKTVYWGDNSRAYQLLKFKPMPNNP